jgi:hypothetical protein
VTRAAQPHNGAGSPYSKCEDIARTRCDTCKTDCGRSRVFCAGFRRVRNSCVHAGELGRVIDTNLKSFQGCQGRCKELFCAAEERIVVVSSPRPTGLAGLVQYSAQRPGYRAGRLWRSNALAQCSVSMPVTPVHCSTILMIFMRYRKSIPMTRRFGTACGSPAAFSGVSSWRRLFVQDGSGCGGHCGIYM